MPRGEHMQYSQRLLYALPAMPLAALTLPLYIIVPTFYSETLGLSLSVVASALLIVRVLDAVNDPLIGWLSDRWRPAFGRRRAVFALSLPLTALATVNLFWPPSDAGGLYIAFWGSVLSIGFTASLLPFAAWGAELTGDYQERSRIAAFREGFTLCGTLIAIVVPFAVGLDNAAGFHGLALLGMSVGLMLVVLGSVTVLTVPEPVEYSRSRVSFVDGIRHMGSNRPFLRLISAFFLNGLANGIPATLFLYFVSDRLGAPEMRGPLLFLYFAAGIVGVPLAVKAAGYFGKHRSWCWAMLLGCASFSIVPALGSGDVAEFAVICVLTGLLLGFDLVLPASIQADVIDIDTLRSGEQRSGLYFAAWSLATKMSLALGVGIVFPLLAYFGFSPSLPQTNTDEALFALAALYAWLPVMLKACAIALMWNFPLDACSQRNVRAEIEHPRQETVPTGCESMVCSTR